MLDTMTLASTRKPFRFPAVSPAESETEYSVGPYFEYCAPETIPPEMSDSELRMLASRSGTYDFWDDPAEDIYTLHDGTPA